MRGTRRGLLKAAVGSGALWAAAAAGMLRPLRAAAHQWNRAAFESAAVAEAFKALGASGAAESREVQFVSPTPQVAENADSVPIAVASRLAGTRSISILVEKNPGVLAASFELSEAAEPFVSTRVKMGGNSKVYALVRARGRHYYAVREITVVPGGCGA